MLIPQNLIGVIAVATYIYKRGAASSITSLISITRELPIGSERGLVRREGVLSQVHRVHSVSKQVLVGCERVLVECERAPVEIMDRVLGKGSLAMIGS